ncbi:hypothetical protein SAMN04488051_104108 [Alkalimonas amylolytica]|uniref:Uncharacterized protein n=2 Tax=Alkalimonas amylolytica TaxID=152573 RepID=A0A1H4CEB7_ALKAM|nr:hypothetical protein SAMN04488051_104108 [Alkalimonas amylolytica]
MVGFTLSKLLTRILLGCLLLLALLSFLLLDFKPSVQNSYPVTPETALLAETFGSRLKGRALQQQHLYITLQESQALIAIGQRAFPKVQAEASMTADRATLALSYPLLAGALHLNVQASLVPEEQGDWLERVQLGSVSIPGSWVLRVLSWQASRMLGSDEVAHLIYAVEQVQLEPNRVRFRFAIPDNLKGGLRSGLPLQRFLHHEPDRTEAYLQQLQAHYLQHKSQELSSYLSVVFHAAYVHSEQAEVSAVLENQAALLALGAFFGPVHFDWLLADGHKLVLTRPGTGEVQLAGRFDLQQHFVYSAVIKALTNRELGLLAGEMKELLDTNPGRSGFSFVDLLADKAGLRFAELALQSEDSAKNLQAFFLQPRDDSDLLPEFESLHEGIQYEQFLSYYVDLDSAAYQKRLALIQQKLGAMPLYRGKD